MRLARDIIVERAIARSSFDPWCPLFIICISRFRAIHPSTGREKKEFLIELELGFTIILTVRLTRLFSRSRSSNDSTMDRQFFFFFISLVDSFVDSKINLYRFAVKFERSSKKKKKFPLLGRVMILQTFWDIHCAWLRTTRSSSSCHYHSSPLFFFFFWSFVSIRRIRVSSNHVAFDSWN